VVRGQRTDMPILTAAEAKTLATEVLRNMGASARVADIVAASVVGADLAGHANHGMAKLLDYRSRVDRGDLDPRGEAIVTKGMSSGSVVAVDGARGFGQPAAKLLISTMVDRLGTEPVVVGGLSRASHTGRLGEWSEYATDRGAVALIFSASVSGSGVAAYGAREARLGTNPLAIGIPADGGDGLTLDMLTCAVAGSRLTDLRNRGLPAPSGAILDADGEPTTDPAALLAGGMLTTFGGHKGYGLALVVALLAGGLVGASDPSYRGPGVLALVLRTDLFANAEPVALRLTTELDRMRSTPPRPGFERVDVPGDFERRHRDDADGRVHLTDTVLAQLQGLTH
jgi:uncharacterized oxidoreductase